MSLWYGKSTIVAASATAGSPIHSQTSLSFFDRRIGAHPRVLRDLTLPGDAHALTAAVKCSRDRDSRLDAGFDNLARDAAARRDGNSGRPKRPPLWPALSRNRTTGSLQMRRAKGLRSQFRRPRRPIYQTLSQQHRALPRECDRSPLTLNVSPGAEKSVSAPAASSSNSQGETNIAARRTSPRRPGRCGARPGWRRRDTRGRDRPARRLLRRAAAGPAIPVTDTARSTPARATAPRAIAAAVCALIAPCPAIVSGSTPSSSTFGLVRIGHKAALDDIGRAGDRGQRRRDEAAGAGFGRRDTPGARPAGGQHGFGEAHCFRVEQR